MADAKKTLRITQVKSSVGRKADQGQTLRALGLGKIGRTVDQVDNDLSLIHISAVANAEHQHHVRPESLIVKTAFVDEGPTLKRIRPRAKGSASRIRKRTSHITIIVAPREEA